MNKCDVCGRFAWLATAYVELQSPLPGSDNVTEIDLEVEACERCFSNVREFLYLEIKSDIPEENPTYEELLREDDQRRSSEMRQENRR